MDDEKCTQDLELSLNGGVPATASLPPEENHRPKTELENECHVETLPPMCKITSVSELLIQHDSPHSVLSYDEGIRAPS